MIHPLTPGHPTSLKLCRVRDKVRVCTLNPLEGGVTRGPNVSPPPEAYPYLKATPRTFSLRAQPCFSRCSVPSKAVTNSLLPTRQRMGVRKPVRIVGLAGALHFAHAATPTGRPAWNSSEAQESRNWRSSRVRVLANCSSPRTSSAKADFCFWRLRIFSSTLPLIRSR